MAHRLPYSLSGCGVPDLRGDIISGENSRSIRAKLGAHYWSFTAHRPPDTSACRRIPNLRGHVFAPSDDLGSIRAEASAKKNIRYAPTAHR